MITDPPSPPLTPRYVLKWLWNKLTFFGPLLFVPGIAWLALSSDPRWGQDQANQLLFISAVSAFVGVGVGQTWEELDGWAEYARQFIKRD